MRISRDNLIFLAAMSFVLLISSGCPNNTPPPPPPVKGPCDPGGRTLNPGERCHESCSSKRACNICCENNGNPAGCSADCTATFGSIIPSCGPSYASVDGANYMLMAMTSNTCSGGSQQVQTLISNNPLDYVPASTLQMLSQAGLAGELNYFVNWLDVYRRAEVVSRLSQVTADEWEGFESALPSVLLSYEAGIQNYAEAWAMNPANPDVRSLIYFSWFSQTF